MSEARLTWRMLAEAGRLPYFGGSGVGALPALYQARGPWRAAVCVAEPASPILAWLRENTEAEIYRFPRPGGAAVPQGPWDAGTVPLSLGDAERDWLDVAGIGRGLGARPTLRRYSPLDELLDTAAGVGLIHTGSLGAAALVRGARRLLRSSAPALLIQRDPMAPPAATLDELTAVAEVLAAAGYALYDPTLSPLSSREEIQSALDAWRETVFLGLPEGSALALLDAGQAAKAPGGYAEAHARAAWAYVSDYRRGPAVDGHVRLQADAIPATEGFYPAENWEDLVWRWTGPKPRATVRLPLARPGVYRLVCRLLKVADGRVLDSLRLFVNGQPIAHTTEPGEHEIVLGAEFVAGLGGFQPYAEILFAHAETYYVNPDDPRRLGLALLEIELERGAA